MTIKNAVLVMLAAIACISAPRVVQLNAAEDKPARDFSLLTLRGHEGWVSAVLFSPDGKRIISGSGDDSVKIWDARTGKMLRTLRGQGKGVCSIAQNSVGARLVAGNWNGTLQLWDLLRGQKLLTLRGHQENVTSVAFSPDGKRLVSGSGDDTLKVWDARTGQVLQPMLCWMGDNWVIYRGAWTLRHVLDHLKGASAGTCIRITG